MSKAEERAREYANTFRPEKTSREDYLAGYEQAEKDTIVIIKSRVSEIIGDAQPKPALRAELEELINKIKE